MAKKSDAKSTAETPRRRVEKTKSDGGRPQDLGVFASPRLKSSALVDTRVIYCGDNLEQLQKLPDACVDLIYPANAGRPRCVQLARVLKKTGSFYYHCDWHASHYVKVMLN